MTKLVDDDVGWQWGGLTMMLVDKNLGWLRMFDDDWLSLIMVDDSWWRWSLMMIDEDQLWLMMVDGDEG